MYKLTRLLLCVLYQQHHNANRKMLILNFKKNLIEFKVYDFLNVSLGRYPFKIFKVHKTMII